MNVDFTGQRALVTGGTRGIGRAIVEVLTECGAAVVATGNEPDRLKTLSKLQNVTALQLDLTDVASTERKADKLSSEHFDVLVNNAGATKRGDFLALSEADWQDGFGLKFFSTVRCSRAAWPFLQAI